MSAGQPQNTPCWDGCASQAPSTVTFTGGPLAHRGLPERDTAEHRVLVTCVTPPRIPPSTQGQES